MRTFHQTVPADGKPRLITVVDTEEEFDWSAPYSRQAASVEHMRSIDRLQDIADQHNVSPVYVVDYPIASQPQASQPLLEFVNQGRASIGAHLHPWVNPPFEEELSARNSYHGNLDRNLECRKLAALTERIRQTFGFSPIVYKAGRYGVGPNTYGILSDLGYKIDLSPAPPLDFSGDGGPDFSHLDCQPFEDPESGLFVAPGSGAFCGWWPGNREAAHRWATDGWRAKLHANALLNRSRAVQRLWLTPETFDLPGLMTLTKCLLNSGHRLFVLSLHSPTVMPGGTPFSSTEQDVKTVLSRLSGYFQFFFKDLAGEPWTPEAALGLWSPSAFSQEEIKIAQTTYVR